MRTALLIVGMAALLSVASAMVVVRFAQIRPEDWHVRPQALVPDSAGWQNWVLYPPGDTDGPVLMPGGAYALKIVAGTSAADVLRKLDRIALSFPRTARVGGRPEDGMMTWVTRSALWGFPDFTTAEVARDGLWFRIAVVARQRYGQGDMGVNAARLSDWLTALDQTS